MCIERGFLLHTELCPPPQRKKFLRKGSCAASCHQGACRYEQEQRHVQRMDNEPATYCRGGVGGCPPPHTENPEAPQGLCSSKLHGFETPPSSHWSNDPLKPFVGISPWRIPQRPPLVSVAVKSMIQQKQLRKCVLQSTATKALIRPFI